VYNHFCTFDLSNFTAEKDGFKFILQMLNKVVFIGCCCGCYNNQRMFFR